MSPAFAMSDIESSVDRIAEETRFSGVVRADRGDDVLLCKAYGLAHRWGIANTIDTRFATASGTKGLTALTVMSLIEEGRLELGTTARSVLGDDLPLIEDAVTVEHLLAHRSGIGDYFDEEIERPKDAYILPIPVHQLATTEAYIRVLDGLRTKFPPGERFSYSNSGYVILALLAERVSGVPFPDLVVQRVCEPGAMVDTAFLRSDDLPGRTALGYIDPSGHRTNVLHLAVRGTGDGGIYTTAADMHAFWKALFAGQIVRTDTLTELLRPRSDVAGDPPGQYGLGFWLFPQLDVVELHGSDAGVSFLTDHSAERRLTYTVLSNTTEGAWPVSYHLDEILSA
jgi:CubicO group peptidase (beta-lactamase class C family)